MAHCSNEPSVQEGQKASAQAMLLGMPGQWIEQPEFGDHYATKLGGLPFFPPGAEKEIDNQLMSCPSCGDMSTLLVQAYAPLSFDDHDLPERVLYLLGCLKPRCSGDPKGWRALRLQGPPSATETLPPKETANETTPAAAPSQASDAWWDDNSWGNNEASTEWEQAGTMDMSQLAHALAEVAESAATSRKEEKLKEAEPACSAVREAENTWNLPVLPGFYIAAQEEPSDSSQGKPKAESSSGVQVEEDPQEKWEGEQYEYSQALTTDRTFLKFKKRLERVPEQCLRYCFQGGPVWARPEQASPGTCPSCGAPRTFELQVMPPTLFFLNEALQEDNQAKCSISGWDWITLVVFTCTKSCRRPEDSERSFSLMEELVFVQQEL